LLFLFLHSCALLYLFVLSSFFFLLRVVSQSLRDYANAGRISRSPLSHSRDPGGRFLVQFALNSIAWLARTVRG
jgi:hypothetical protein